MKKIYLIFLGIICLFSLKANAQCPPASAEWVTAGDASNAFDTFNDSDAAYPWANSTSIGNGCGDTGGDCSIFTPGLIQGNNDGFDDVTVVCFDFSTDSFDPAQVGADFVGFDFSYNICSSTDQLVGILNSTAYQTIGGVCTPLIPSTINPYNHPEFNDPTPANAGIAAGGFDPNNSIHFCIEIGFAGGTQAEANEDFVTCANAVTYGNGAPVCDEFNALSFGPSCSGYSICIGYIDSDVNGIGDFGEDPTGINMTVSDGLSLPLSPSSPIDDGIVFFDASNDGVDTPDAVGYCYTVEYTNLDCAPAPYTPLVSLTCADGSAGVLAPGFGGTTITNLDILADQFGVTGGSAIYPNLTGIITPPVCPTQPDNSDAQAATVEVFVADADGTATSTSCLLISGDAPSCNTAGGDNTAPVQFNPTDDPLFVTLNGSTTSYACGINATADLSYNCGDCGSPCSIGADGGDLSIAYCYGDLSTESVGQDLNYDDTGFDAGPNATINAGVAFAEICGAYDPALNTTANDPSTNPNYTGYTVPQGFTYSGNGSSTSAGCDPFEGCDFLTLVPYTFIDYSTADGYTIDPDNLCVGTPRIVSFRPQIDISATSSTYDCSTGITIQVDGGTPNDGQSCNNADPNQAIPGDFTISGDISGTTTSGEFTVTDLANGTYNYTITDEQNCSEANFSFEVTCSQACEAVFNYTVPTEVCGGSDILFDLDELTCDLASSLLDPDDDRYTLDLYMYADANGFEAPANFIPNPVSQDGFPLQVTELNFLADNYLVGCPGSDYTIGTSDFNVGCEPIVVTFYIIPYDFNLDSNGDSTYGGYVGDGGFNGSLPVEECEPLRFDVTIYPEGFTAALNGGNEAPTCSPMVDLLAADGTVCNSQAANCGATTNDGISYNFTNSVTDPLGCQSALSGTLAETCDPACYCNSEIPIISFSEICPGDDFMVYVDYPGLVHADYQTVVYLMDETGAVVNQVDVTAGGDANFGNVLNAGNYSAMASNFSILDASCTQSCEPLINVINPEEFFVSATQQTFNGGLGVTPFTYNTHVIEFSGGTGPYTYDWTIDGFVRYSTPGTGSIVVTYADHAAWTVEVTDNNGCSENVIVFSNDPSVSGMFNQILDIYDSSITYDNCYTLDASEGTVDILVEGGTPDYTYEWEGPNTWDGTGQGSPNISNCSTGWYYVTVTDSGAGSGLISSIGNPTEQQQVTEGWYWVGCARPGRGKVANNNINVYPNPASNNVSIDFGMELTDKITIGLYTIEGRYISDVFSGNVEANTPYSLTIDTEPLPSGTYLVQMNSDTGLQTNTKVVIMH